MEPKQAMIRGYEIAKTTELSGELQLAKEVADISDYTINLCNSCEYGEQACTATNNGKNSPVCSYKMIGFSSCVTQCDVYQKK